jgi:hypothetical protein
MKHTTRLTLSFLAVTTLAACGGITEPQTYFSTVFDDVEQSYVLDNNAEGHVLANFLADVSVTRGTTTTTYTFAFYTTGMTRTRIGAVSLNGQSVQATITTTYDYGTNGGVFTETTYPNASSENTKVYTNFSTTTLARYLNVMNQLETTLTPGVRGIINSQASNLLIGGQATNLDWKTYTLPVNTFIDSYAPFESLVDFLPTSVEVVIRYQATTSHVDVTLDAQNSTSSFSAQASLREPGNVDATDYQLTNEEKATFTGFTA